MELFSAAGSLDISDWVRGLLGAAISGGSAAISGGAGGALIAPEHFNIHSGQLYELIAGMFLFNAFISLSKFLALHPLPDLKTVTTSVVVSQQGTAPPVTVATVSETHQELKQ